jgi:uncharacterized membrane protein
MTFNDPTTLPLSFVLLEAGIILWAALTLRHAIGAHRAGDRAALLTWLTIFVYGLVMELVSYNAVDNFAHGQFTVMFYADQLPLYITVVYPVLLYTGIALARRLCAGRDVSPAAVAITAGIFIVCVDVPFDITGPRLGWWRWYDNDPNIAYRWLGVPVTSYYWHLSFGAILCALTAWAARRAAARGSSRRSSSPSLWLCLPITIGTIVLGVIGFLPFHGLKAIGVGDGVIVGAALAAAAVTAVYSVFPWPGSATSSERRPASTSSRPR